MTVKELASRINDYLLRFEKDPEVNRYPEGHPSKRHGYDRSIRPFYGARAFAQGRYVRVMYISYQGGAALTKAEAEKYLAKLDEGFVGRHWDALR